MCRWGRFVDDAAKGEGSFFGGHAGDDRCQGEFNEFFTHSETHDDRRFSEDEVGDIGVNEGTKQRPEAEQSGKREARLRFAGLRLEISPWNHLFVEKTASQERDEGEKPLLSISCLAWGMNGEKENAFESCEDADICGLGGIVGHQERSSI